MEQHTTRGRGTSPAALSRSGDADIDTHVVLFLGLCTPYLGSYRNLPITNTLTSSYLTSNLFSHSFRQLFHISKFLGALHHPYLVPYHNLPITNALPSYSYTPLFFPNFSRPNLHHQTPRGQYQTQRRHLPHYTHHQHTPLLFLNIPTFFSHLFRPFSHTSFIRLEPNGLTTGSKGRCGTKGPCILLRRQRV
jgi:hypothetical protein